MGEVRRYDQTLLDYEIQQLVTDDPSFIEGFDREGVKGASYDLHAGDELYVATAASRGIITLSPEPLREEGNDGRIGFRIEPGQSAVIRTRECLHMPDDVLGQVSLRATWAARGLSYPSGVIAPAYWGYLFFAITNTEESVIEIPVRAPGGTAIGGEDALVKIQFIRLHAAPRNLKRMPRQTTLPVQRRPRPPKVDPYPPLRLKELIDEQQAKLEALDLELRTDLAVERASTGAVVRIVEYGFFALVAGIGASVGVGALQFARNIGGEEGGAVALALGAFVVILVLTSLFTSLLRQISAVFRGSGRHRSQKK
jgi:deoxycytidine triphosphate deaminase